MAGPKGDGIRFRAIEKEWNDRSRREAEQRSWAQRRLDERRDRVDEDPASAWRRRHPQIAAQERQLRKQRAEVLKRWKHKNDGTPETHEHASRCNQGALARLYQSGAIDSEQLAAAEEIGRVAERIARDVTVRTASLETRVDITRIGDGGFFELLGQVRREVAYTWWRERLPFPAIVLDMLTAERVGFTVAAARHRIHNRKAKRLLIDALDLWPEALSLAFKQVDEKDLAIAHARLLAA
jgi:hypothetical protein